MGHVLVTVAHGLQLRLVLFVGLREFKVNHIFGDISHEDFDHRLIEVLIFPRIDVNVESLFFAFLLILLKTLLIKRGLGAVNVDGLREVVLDLVNYIVAGV